MAEKRVKRRLAAIMAADVVGYSRLMGADGSNATVGLWTPISAIRRYRPKRKLDAFVE